MPKINLRRLGSASAAAATGAILAIAPVFAQNTTPTPSNGSVITIIITAANAASVTYTFTVSAETAAELAAKLAEHQAELAAEAAQAPETEVDENDEDDADVEAADVETGQMGNTHKVTVTVNGQTAKPAEHETERGD